MIFVTVGTHYASFDRLIKKMDEIALNLDDEVIMQIGHTDYKPKNAKWFKFLDMKDIHDLYKKADVIISHAGAGTLIECLSYEKPLIIVPRLKKFNEHIDDQQIELAEALDKTNKAIAVCDIAKLADNLKASNNYKFKRSKKNNDLKNFLNNNLRGTFE